MTTNAIEPASGAASVSDAFKSEPSNSDRLKRLEAAGRFYQNGTPLNTRLLSEAEIDLLARLAAVPAGRYLYDLVSVRHLDRGAAYGGRDIHLDYRTARQDRLILSHRVTSFEHMLTRILAEANAAQAVTK
jgi:hypothetical protein